MKHLVVESGDAPEIMAAASLLREGALVVFVTETVYGIGARLDDAESVARLIRVKGRPEGKPFSVMAPDLEGARALARRWSPEAEALARAFWPGPLTLILDAHEELARRAGSADGSLGVRVPGHPVTEALLRATGVALAVPSANRSGHPAPRDFEELRAALSLKDVSAVVDAGRCALGVASTIVDVRGGVKLLRQGAISVEEMKSVLEVDVERFGSSGL